MWSPGELRAFARTLLRFTVDGEPAVQPEVSPFGVLDLSASKRSMRWEEAVVMEDKGEGGVVICHQDGRAFVVVWPPVWGPATRRACFDLMAGWWTAARTAAARLVDNEEGRCAAGL